MSNTQTARRARIVKALASVKQAPAPTKAQVAAKAAAKARDDAIAANVAKRNTEEQQARAANAAKLQQLRAKPAPQPKPLPKGSGALIGVAQGAMDGQPHTKLAVAQARARHAAADANTTEAPKVYNSATGKLETQVRRGNVWLAPAQAKKYDAILAKYKTAEGQAKALQAAGFAPAEKPAKTKAPAQPKAPRAPQAPKPYKVLNRNHGAKPDSKRAKQLEIVFKHKDTASAKAAGAESVDFAFAVAKGFIAYTA